MFNSWCFLVESNLPPPLSTHVSSRQKLTSNTSGSWLVLRCLNRSKNSKQTHPNHPKKKQNLLVMVQKSWNQLISTVVKPSIYKVLHTSQVVQHFFHQQYVDCLNVSCKSAQNDDHNSSTISIYPTSLIGRKVFTTLLKSEECFILDSHSSKKKSHNHPNDYVITCSITCFLSFWGPAHFEGLC